VLRRVAEPRLLTQEYLSLRLQLWALARRAADNDVLRNGLWLTALLGLDRALIS
jgi:hypothetical protein